MCFLFHTTVHAAFYRVTVATLFGNRVECSSRCHWENIWTEPYLSSEQPWEAILFFKLLPDLLLHLSQTALPCRRPGLHINHYLVSARNTLQLWCIQHCICKELNKLRKDDIIHYNWLLSSSIYSVSNGNNIHIPAQPRGVFLGQYVLLFLGTFNETEIFCGPWCLTFLHLHVTVTVDSLFQETSSSQQPRLHIFNR